MRQDHGRMNFYKKCTVLSERLKSARKSAGYPSALKASKTFGWPHGSFSRHEGGHSRFSLKYAKKYAEAFNVSVDWLIGLDEGLSVCQPFFGKKLRDLRIRKGLSLSQFGKIVSLSKQRIHQIEQISDYLDRKVVASLAQALGVEPDFFSTPDDICQ